MDPNSPPMAQKLERGTVMAVGSHTVTVDRYISAGGFAQIYAVKIPENDSIELCLKRVIVQSKEGLNQLRGEVEVMQRLARTKNIVQYLDSNAQKLPDGQYEVLVLMELCTQSLLDYMNAKLKTKLNEIEIVQIMGDVALAVYGMHQMKLIHRDIKIENVLIDKKGKFKLCDFGSTCPVLRVPQTPQEFQMLHNDLMRQTTPQYRAPEMIDLYRGNPIDEKGDIWALGVFLYKLCYYTTPFETVGELGILHSVYSFPKFPIFSNGLKQLINLMLQENPQYRPNIYQVLMELNKLGTSIIVDDFYHLGEYHYPPKEQRFDKLVPFISSNVPMYQPFRKLSSIDLYQPQPVAKIDTSSSTTPPSPVIPTKSGVSSIKSIPRIQQSGSSSTSVLAPTTNAPIITKTSALSSSSPPPPQVPSHVPSQAQIPQLPQLSGSHNTVPPQLPPQPNYKKHMISPSNSIHRQQQLPQPQPQPQPQQPPPQQQQLQQGPSNNTVIDDTVNQHQLLQQQQHLPRRVPSQQSVSSSNPAIPDYTSSIGKDVDPLDPFDINRKEPPISNEESDNIIEDDFDFDINQVEDKFPDLELNGNVHHVHHSVGSAPPHVTSSIGSELLQIPVNSLVMQLSGDQNSAIINLDSDEGEDKPEQLPLGEEEVEGASRLGN